jgi:hypothetical protein
VRGMRPYPPTTFVFSVRPCGALGRPLIFVPFFKQALYTPWAVLKGGAPRGHSRAPQCSTGAAGMLTAALRVECSQFECEYRLFLLVCFLACFCLFTRVSCACICLFPNEHDRNAHVLIVRHVLRMQQSPCIHV